MKYNWATAATVICLLGTPVAQAGILEDLLARPAIQALLGRQPDMQNMVRNCTDPTYRARNLNACVQSDQASRLALVPAELRAVLAVPASAASLREVCLAVQSTPVQNSRLCAELSKADSGFQVLAEQQRNAPQIRAMRENAEQPN